VVQALFCQHQQKRQENDMKIIETVQIGDNGDGTYKVWSKSHDEVADCKSYQEALFVFQQFFGGIMDEYNDAVVESEAYRSGWYD
jgi:hypothetical protein